MLSGLYIKIIASLIVLSLVGGGYLYVRHLISENANLNRENATLSQTNDELKGEIKEQVVIQNAIEKVTQAGDKQREQNKTVEQNQLKHIDEGVQAGKDRKVGPILQDFFNG